MGDFTEPPTALMVDKMRVPPPRHPYGPSQPLCFDPTCVHCMAHWMVRHRTARETSLILRDHLRRLADLKMPLTYAKLAHARDLLRDLMDAL